MIFIKFEVILWEDLLSVGFEILHSCLCILKESYLRKQFSLIRQEMRALRAHKCCTCKDFEDFYKL